MLECVDRQCGPEEVMIDGECYNVDEKSFCPGIGEAIFLNERGEPSCQCKDGWGRKERENLKKKLVWGDKSEENIVDTGGRCYQELTTGFCSKNLLVKSFEENLFGCINNPCGNSEESILH